MVIPVELPQAGLPYHQKISYSLIEPQPLPSTPAYGHEIHAFAFNPHPAPLVGSAFKIPWEVCCGDFFAETVVFRLADVYAEELRLRFQPLELQGNLEPLMPLNFPDLHQTQMQ